MKKIIGCVAFLFIFFASFNVYALEKCTENEMKRLRELANNVQFKYQYQIDEEIEEEEKVFGHYKLEILNLDDDLRIYYKVNDHLKYFSKNEIEKMEFAGSKKEIFYIYSYTDNYCTDEIIRTISVQLPVYNDYYHFNKKKCEQYSDFKYCKEYLDIGDIEFSEIDKILEEKNKDKDITEKQENGLIEKYIWYIVGSLIVIGILSIITVLIRKKIKNNDDI